MGEQESFVFPGSNPEPEVKEVRSWRLVQNTLVHTRNTQGQSCESTTKRLGQHSLRLFIVAHSPLPCERHSIACSSSTPEHEPNMPQRLRGRANPAPGEGSSGAGGGGMRVSTSSAEGLSVGEGGRVWVNQGPQQLVLLLKPSISLCSYPRVQVTIAVQAAPKGD